MEALSPIAQGYQIILEQQNATQTANHQTPGDAAIEIPIKHFHSSTSPLSLGGLALMQGWVRLLDLGPVILLDLFDTVEHLETGPEPVCPHLIAHARVAQVEKV